MKIFSKRRLAILCAGLGTVGAASAVTFGATNALYTSSADPQHNTITSGTITLTENSSASKAIAITGLMPGDGSCYSPPSGATYTCDTPRNEYALSYTGSNPAFVGLNIKVTSTASQACPNLTASSTVVPATLAAECTGTGQLPLFDGNSGGGDLDLALTPENGDTAHQLVLDSDLVSNASCSADASKVATCTAEIDNVLMPVGYGNTANAGLKWSTGSTDFVQVDTGLPLAAGNQFQGSGVAIDLQAHAVQWDNNNTTVGGSPACASGTVFPNGLGSNGNPCPTSWS